MRLLLPLLLLLAAALVFFGSGQIVTVVQARTAHVLEAR